MPKENIVTPEEFLNINDMEVGTIPMMRYNKTLKEELDSNELNLEDVKNIYFQMKLIRVFEEALNSIKMKNEWNGIEYNYPGPAHMEIGNEAAVVGLHFDLNKDDFVFGTHRNHGEVIAKGMNAIKKLSDDELISIMNEYHNDSILKALEKNEKFKSYSTRNKSEFYLIYGLLSEIFVKETGVNKGMSGSMHMFFTPYGIYPNNAVVGASGSLAFGTALFKLINEKPGISIANVGDGGISTGPIWETMNFAAMDQYKELWNEPFNKRPPFMLNIMNNAYGMGGQTIGETMGNKGPIKLATAINPENCHAEVINGQNPLAAIDLIRRKYDVVKNGDGPVVNEIRTYRLNGHSSGDPESYRTREELELWSDFDPIKLFKKEIEKFDVLSEEEILKIDSYINEMFEEAFRLSIDDKISPPLTFENDENKLDDLMFSREKMKTTPGKPDVLISEEDKESNPRIKRNSRKSRSGYDENGEIISPMKSIQIRDSIFEAILDRFYEEPSFIAFSQETRDWGGAYGVYQGLTQALPYHRFFNTPITEAAMVGAATGYAMAGGQALVEIMYFDFLFRAGDELSSQLSKWRAMSGGEFKFPIVIRTNIGSSYGVQHSQDYTTVIAAITGLNVVLPATPFDAKGLMNSALSSSDPTFFVETQKIYNMNERFKKNGVPLEKYEIPFGQADVKKEGNDLTIVTLGVSLYQALEASKELEKYGIDVELIDMRTAVPFDYETIINSVNKTGRVIFMNEGFERANFMKHVSQIVTEHTFDNLKNAPIVLGARNWVVPGSGFDEYLYPSVEDVLSAIHHKMFELDGYTPTRNHSKEEQLRRNKLGV